MPRRPIVILTSLAILLGAGGCAGGRRAVDHEGARERAREILVGREIDPLDREAANDAASCIADGLFNDPDVFSPDERNDVLVALDGTRPREDLAARVVALVEECDALPGTGGGRGEEPDAAPRDDEDEASTTTTES